jgi:hypothetical protein
VVFCIFLYTTLRLGLCLEVFYLDPAQFLLEYAGQAGFFDFYDPVLYLLMFKSVIAPMQAWLLSQGRCVGCGTELSLGKKKESKYGEQVTCKCGRIFIHDVKTNKYRRALLEEV